MTILERSRWGQWRSSTRCSNSRKSRSAPFQVGLSTENTIRRSFSKATNFLSCAEILHLLKVAIRDKNVNLSMYYASKLSDKSLKKKDQVSVNRTFLLALMNGVVPVVLHFLERGFPRDVNAPVFEIVLEGGDHGTSSILCPSYFMLAVSFGQEEVVSAMSRVCVTFFRF